MKVEKKMAARDFFAVRVTTPENTLLRGHPRKPPIHNNLISISFEIKWLFKVRECKTNTYQICVPIYDRNHFDLAKLWINTNS